MEIKRIQFHIQSQDYFGTLATRLHIRRLEEMPLDDLIDELVYLPCATPKGNILAPITLGIDINPASQFLSQQNLVRLRSGH
jgi:hypothetical protein